MKLGGLVGSRTRNNWFLFREDPIPDPDLIIFLRDSSPLRDSAKPIYYTISPKVVDAFGRKLVNRLGVWQG